ncbi:MAG: ComEC/Rec2 family competence protein [Patescibacteria group bacterium]
MQWIKETNAILPLTVGGIFTGAFFGTVGNPLIVSGFFVCVAVALILITLLRKRRHSVFLWGVVLILCAALLGSTRAYFFDQSISEDLVQFEGARVHMVGVVSSAPEKRETTTRLRVQIESVNQHPTLGVVMVSTDPYNAFHYGDRVAIEGVIKKPESFETDTGRAFNYEKFLRAHRVTHVISFANVEVVEENAGNQIIAALTSFKDTLVSRIELLLPDPEAPLLSGLLLGEQQSLGTRLYESFQRAGVVHMVVLSGYNVSLIVQALSKITETFLPLAARSTVLILAIVSFALMTGASETTVRASLMAGILLVGTLLARPHDALRALLVAGGVMVLWNPYLLLFDLSFQLSFVATAGILLWANPLAQKLSWLTERFGIREIAGATLAAQIAVLPVLVLSIGSVSLVAPFANILVLGAVPYAMFFGFVASVISFVHPLLALPFTFITQALLVYILTVSVWFGNLPFAAITIPWF